MKTSIRNAQASINKMHGTENTVKLTCEVQVANPGVRAALSRIEPESPATSDFWRLELRLSQLPGKWTQQLTWVQASWSQNIANQINRPTSIEVVREGTVVLFIDEIKELQ